MAAGARARGYAYLCIADHSHSSTIANGLSAERLAQHAAAVRRVARTLPNLHLWIGTEVDILADGRLDYPDEVLGQLDFVIASIHAGMGQDIESNTRRTLAAMQNPYVNLIGHPTGRLLNKREAMALDIDAVAREAARTGTALELNASNFRLDLKDQHARRARELGALLCINTDAHAVDQLDELVFGVTTARRAGLCKGDVLNTWTAAQVRKFVRRKREKGTR
jgi:DNA polymerase (family 10)